MRLCRRKNSDICAYSSLEVFSFSTFGAECASHCCGYDVISAVCSTLLESSHVLGGKSLRPLASRARVCSAICNTRHKCVPAVYTFVCVERVLLHLVCFHLVPAVCE